MNDYWYEQSQRKLPNSRWFIMAGGVGLNT